MHRQTADANAENDHWPVKLVPTRFRLYKDEAGKNPMQRAKPDQPKTEEAAETTETEKKSGEESESPIKRDKDAEKKKKPTSEENRESDSQPVDAGRTDDADSQDMPE